MCFTARAENTIVSHSSCDEFCSRETKRTQTFYSYKHPFSGSLLLFFFKRANSYICTKAGEIICQTGWREPTDPDQRNPLIPCAEPICDHTNAGCVHGVCKSPNYCACEVGWEGMSCDSCIPLPGCKHGYCELALECNCESGYGGGYCDIRK